MLPILLHVIACVHRVSKRSWVVGDVRVCVCVDMYRHIYCWQIIMCGDTWADHERAQTVYLAF